MQGTTNISNPSWSTLGTVVTDTSGHASYTNYPVGERMFYRSLHTGDSIIVATDPSSPLAGQVKISQTTTTYGVPLAVFDVKSQNVASSMTQFTVVIQATGSQPYMSLVNNIRIRVGSLEYAPTAIKIILGQKLGVYFYSNMVASLQSDIAVPVVVLADINPSTNGSLDGMTLTASVYAKGTVGGQLNNPYAEDAAFVSRNVVTSTNFGSQITFTSQSGTLSSQTASVLSAIISNIGGVTTTIGYNVSFGFTVTAGNETLYMSSNPAQMLTITSSPGSSGSLPLAGMISTPSSLAGDSNTSSTNGWYVIPAGSSRSFTFVGTLMNTNGLPGLKTMSINAVKYGTSTSNLSAYSIGYGLQALAVTVSF